LLEQTITAFAQALDLVQQRFAAGVGSDGRSGATETSREALPRDGKQMARSGERCNPRLPVFLGSKATLRPGIRFAVKGEGLRGVNNAAVKRYPPRERGFYLETVATQSNSRCGWEATEHFP
jgi:hypothetical protein